MKKFASSIDVAKLAGVSQSAVSRTFTPGASVSEATRKKVKRAAEQLGYRPSLIPRIMLTDRSFLVAVAIGGMYNPFNSTVLEQLTLSLQEKGYQTLLLHLDLGAPLDEIIPHLMKYRVDAIFIARASISQDAAAELSKLRIPLIVFHKALNYDWAISLMYDNVAAGKKAARHLCEKGSTSFAYFCGDPLVSTSEEREFGFVSELVDRGATSPQIIKAPHNYKGGYDAALQAFSCGRSPNGIFCTNDVMALGAIDAMRHELGMQVPRDALVVGFDNIPASSWAAYRLTTFSEDEVTMVETAVNTFEAIVEEKETQKRIIIPAKLIERESTSGRGDKD